MPYSKNIENIFLLFLKEDNNDDINKKIQQLTKGDWEFLYRFALENSVLPAFYAKLQKLNPGNIPSDFILKVKNTYLLNLSRNLILERKLFEIVTHLEKNNIPVIPLKGPAIAKLLYNDVALRQTSCDLDLLVPRERMEEAERKLEEIGYSYRHCREANYFRQYERQILLQKQNSPFIDLHWNSRDRFTNVDIEELWADAKYIDVDGYKILALSNEALLLYLTLAAISKSNFIQMKYLYDIHRLITRFSSEIDWQVLFKRAKRFNLNIALFFSLKLTKDLFNTNISQEILGALSPRFIKRKILELWINKTNVLRFRQKIALAYSWRYFATSYIYSKDIFDCLKNVYKKVFLPMEEVMGLWDKPLSKTSYGLYIKRLLNPVNHLSGKSI